MFWLSRFCKQTGLFPDDVSLLAVPSAANAFPWLLCLARKTSSYKMHHRCNCVGEILPACPTVNLSFLPLYSHPTLKSVLDHLLCYYICIYGCWLMAVGSVSSRYSSLMLEPKGEADCSTQPSVDGLARWLWVPFQFSAYGSLLPSLPFCLGKGEGKVVPGGLGQGWNPW